MPSSRYKDVDGFRVCKSLPEEVVRSGLRYKPRPGDLFIVSYPKCGTTWMQHIVYNIINGQPPPKSQLACWTEMPYLELQGAESVQDMKRPGPIKTHIPFRSSLYSEDAKYIYMARNPYDCCVSFFYHTKGMGAYGFEEGTFDEFFDMFMEGDVDSGDYFDNLLSWYEHRQEPNVLFLTYEQLKKDTRTWILRIANFIGEQYGQKLRNDAVLFENVLANTTVKSMKERVNESMQNMLADDKMLPAGKIPPKWFTLLQMSAGNDAGSKKMAVDFVRKGTVGDWRSHFSEYQIRRLKERIEEKTRGSDVMNLWKDEDIP